MLSVMEFLGEPSLSLSNVFDNIRGFSIFYSIILMHYILQRSRWR